MQKTLCQARTGLDSICLRRMGDLLKQGMTGQGMTGRRLPARALEVHFERSRLTALRPITHIINSHAKG